MTGGTAKPAVILIAGPTASGKSALALALAERLEAAIVNADSMQVYRDLRLLTARPSAGEEARAPHHLYGVLDGAQACSAGLYARMASDTLDALAREGRPALIVGGTGLYFRTLTEGLSEIPPVSDAGREAAQDKLDRLGPAGLHAELSQRDPATARMLRPSDPQRLMRALALLEETGEGLATWQARPLKPVLRQPAAKYVLDGDRAWLYARADARFETMLRMGALEEVRALRARALDPALPIMKAVGVSELGAVIDGRLDLEAAKAAAQQATRRYIKRQLTWFRNQMADWRRIDAQDDAKNLPGLLNEISKSC